MLILQNDICSIFGWNLAAKRLSSIASLDMHVHIADLFFCVKVAKGQDDPCKEVICPRGRMCVPRVDNDNGKTYTICECPNNCPEGASDPVCSYYNREFNSRCSMHSYGCAHDLTMKVKNQGSCPSDGKYK